MRECSLVSLNYKKMLLQSEIIRLGGNVLIGNSSIEELIIVFEHGAAALFILPFSFSSFFF